MEFITSAIVLDREPVREHDELVHLYSRNRGRLLARAVSSRRHHSRFSHHIDPLNSVTVRLVGNGRWVLADAVTCNRFSALRADVREFSRALRLAFFIREFFPEGGIDEHAWDFFESNLGAARVDIRGFLSLLGFGIGEACRKCGAQSPEKFSLDEHVFFCVSCGSKIPANRLLLM